MKAKYKKTTRYALFRADDSNRDVTKIKKLVASIKKHGYLDAFPIMVVKNCEGYVIKDGQHRFAAAKQLGQPLVYCEGDFQDVNVAQLNNTQRAWSMADYLSSYVRQGNEDYLKLKAYRDRTGIGLSQCISILNGEGVGCNRNHEFRDGLFKIANQNKAEHLAEVVLAISALVPWAKNSLFVNAVTRCLYVPPFNHREFIDQATKYKKHLEKQANLKAYSELVETIYNHNKKNRIPLCFWADEAMRKRNAAA